ncbi:MAG: hypothetical protein RL748_1254, partial [Pseudomonadota bacterium]
MILKGSVLLESGGFHQRHRNPEYATLAGCRIERHGHAQFNTQIVNIVQTNTIAAV